MDAIGQILRKVRRTVVRRGAPVHDAEDIVQEAFARMEAYLDEVGLRADLPHNRPQQLEPWPDPFLHDLVQRGRRGEDLPGQ